MSDENPPPPPARPDVEKVFKRLTGNGSDVATNASLRRRQR